MPVGLAVGLNVVGVVVTEVVGVVVVVVVGVVVSVVVAVMLTVDVIEVVCVVVGVVLSQRPKPLGQVALWANENGRQFPRLSWHGPNVVIV